MPPKTAAIRSKAPAPESPPRPASAGAGSPGTKAKAKSPSPKRSGSATPKKAASPSGKSATSKKAGSSSPSAKTPAKAKSSPKGGSKTPASASKGGAGRARSTSKKGGPAGGKTPKGETLHNLSFGRDGGVDGVIQLYGDIAEKTNDPNALFACGWMYLFGLGDVAKDTRKAYAYLVAAADGNHEMAIYHMAQLQAEGTGTKKSVVKAIANYERAAALGNSLAMLQLGKLYDKPHPDEELARDAAKSKSWLQKAADAGNELAKKRLERMERA